MKATAIITLIVLSGVVLAASFCAPMYLADNSFLRGFVNHELLNIQAVIMTITIATIATIHIWFNELEQKHQKKVFGDARAEINSSAIWLITLFIICLFWLILRSFFDGNIVAMSIFNGFAVVILVANVLVLIDILLVVKSLTPKS